MQEGQGVIPSLAATISDIGYLLLPSRDMDEIQCCRNTLEFCQTSVWQNSRFCRTEQNFVGPNFLKSLLLNYVRYYFQSLKGKKYSIYIKVLRVPTKQRDDLKNKI